MPCDHFSYYTPPVPLPPILTAGTLSKVKVKCRGLYPNENSRDFGQKVNGKIRLFTKGKLQGIRSKKVNGMKVFYLKETCMYFGQKSTGKSKVFFLNENFHSVQFQL